MSDSRIDALEQRLRRLEDRAAIAELTARYAMAVNQGWDGAEVDIAALPDIFAPGAVWHSRAMAVRAEGLEAIAAGVAHGTRATNFAMHSYTNPVVRIDGDHAEANWLLFIASRRHRGPPNLIFLEDAIGYRRIGEGWRIQRVERRFGMEMVDGASSHRDG